MVMFSNIALFIRNQTSGDHTGENLVYYRTQRSCGRVMFLHVSTGWVSGRQPPGQTHPPGQTPPPVPPWSLLRTVRILLECILVYQAKWKNYVLIHVRKWLKGSKTFQESNSPQPISVSFKAAFKRLISKTWSHRIRYRWKKFSTNCTNVFVFLYFRYIHFEVKRFTSCKLLCKFNGSWGMKY